MTEGALFAALLAFGPHCDSGQARRLAAAIVPAARAYRLDPLLLVAVTLHETGRTCRHAVRWERAGGCSVGPFQVYLPDCAEAQRRYSDPRRAARRAARILALGRARCRATVGVPWYCRRNLWWGRYNPGSRRWALSVGRLYDRLRAWSRRRGIARGDRAGRDRRRQAPREGS